MAQRGFRKDFETSFSIDNQQLTVPGNVPLSLWRESALFAVN
jgi:hypothetical protein